MEILFKINREGKSSYFTVTIAFLPSIIFEYYCLNIIVNINSEIYESWPLNEKLKIMIM